MYTITSTPNVPMHDNPNHTTKYIDFIDSNDHIEYTGKVFRIGDGVDRPIVEYNGYNYIAFLAGRHGVVDLVSLTGIRYILDKVRMPIPDASFLKFGQEHSGLYASTGNSKIQHAAKLVGKNKAISIGKAPVLSCMMAGKCLDYCYSIKDNRQYLSLLAWQLHNYYLIYNGNETDIYNLLSDVMVSYNPDLVRYDDNGDVMSIQEFRALVMIAVNNPDAIVYLYTKSTGILLQLLDETDGSLPSNLRVNISDTDNVDSLHFANEIRSRYPIATCYIAETVDEMKAYYKSGIDFNKNEIMAINADKDFMIAIHGTFRKDTPEFYANKFRMRLEQFGFVTC